MLPLHHDPRNRSEAGVSIVVRSCLLSIFRFLMSNGPRWSRTTAAAVSERHASVTTPGRKIGEAGIEPAVTCARDHRSSRRCPVGHHYPSPRLVLSSSSGNRTPSSALKGQHPEPVDERAVRARCARSGSGGARIHVSRSSAWRGHCREERWSVSATDPLNSTKKARCLCDTGL